MKRVVTIVFLFLMLAKAGVTFQTKVHAQQPYSSGQQWNVFTIPTSNSISKSTVIFHSDNHYVQYAGNVYKILYGDSGDIINEMYGIYREDNGKVFMREFNSWQQPKEEYLIYDWNLDIGETVYVQYGESETGLVLDAITDTTINDNSYRVFHLHYLSNSNFTEKWIEGIGSELGFPFPGTKNNPVSPFYYPMTADLLCYYENGELLWDNPNYDECIINYWIGVSESEETPELSIYPNPTKDNVTINYSAQGEAVIEFFDVLGRKKYQDIMIGNEKKVETEGLLKGVYIVIIRDQKSTKRTVLLKK